jgi:hypothetical protein
MINRAVICGFLLISMVTIGNAAECTYTGLLQDIKNLPSGSAERQNAIARMLKLRANAACFANLLLAGEPPRNERVSFESAIKRFETVRTDKQAGSSSGTGGTTTIVSKGITARVLAVAAEYGALRESTSEQVVTLQGSLEGIPAVLVRRDVFPYCPSDYKAMPGCLHQSLFQALRRFSYTVSFNTTQNGKDLTGTAAGPAQGSSQQVNFTASQKQLAAVGGRFILWNARDATSKEFEDAWNKQLKDNTTIKTAADELQNSMNTLLGTVEHSSEYVAWFHKYLARLTADDNSQIDTEWGAAAADLVQLVKAQAPTIIDNANAFGLSLRTFRFEEDTFVDTLANKPVLTFEYNNNRPVNQESTSTFRLIFDKGLGRWSLAANGALAGC